MYLFIYLLPDKRIEAVCELPLLLLNTTYKIFLHKSGAVQSVECRPGGELADEGVTLDKTFKIFSPNRK
jgi:hypothetical protein